MIVNHEVQDRVEGFSHRLVAPGKGVGLWVSYRMPATLKIKNVGTFVACTEYWKDVEPFPVPEKIYLVKEKT
jgi:hypothetical protein